MVSRNTSSRMNKRVTFYNPAGALVDGWPSTEPVEYTSVWAEIKTLNGNRIFRADAVQWIDKSVIITRYRDDIKRTMQVSIGGKMHEIESLTNDDERNQWLTIIVKEVL